MISTVVPADRLIGQLLLAFAPSLVSDARVYSYAPAQLVQAKASLVMTADLAKAAPIDVASARVQNVVIRMALAVVRIKLENH